MSLSISLLITVYLATAITAQNTSLPMMPLKYFRNSGLQNAMYQNTSDAYIDLFKSNFRMNGISSDPFTLTAGEEEKVNQFGSLNIEDLERSSGANVLPHANCNPYDQVISLPNDKPNVLLYPSCVVIKQCGGCCGHPALMCKPTRTESKYIQVTQYVYDGQQAHPVEQVAALEVQEHKACQCQCKLTEADCNPALHYFDDWDCKCVCRQQQQSCPLNMRWDENLCACRCSSVQNCGTGYTYNLVTCSCEAVNGRSNIDEQPDTNTQRPSLQEDNRVTETVTQKDTCSHVRCPRRYKPQMKNGTCKCVFSRGRK